MYNQLLISLQIEEKWYTFRLFFGILSCYYLQTIEHFFCYIRKKISYFEQTKLNMRI